MTFSSPELFSHWAASLQYLTFAPVVGVTEVKLPLLSLCLSESNEDAQLAPMLFCTGLMLH